MTALAIVALIVCLGCAWIWRRALYLSYADLDSAHVAMAGVSASLRSQLQNVNASLAHALRERDRIEDECEQRLDEICEQFEQALTAARGERDKLTARIPRETSASIARWQNDTFGPATTDVRRVQRSWTRLVEAFADVRAADLSIRRPNLSRAIRAAEELAELIEMLVRRDDDPVAGTEVADVRIVLAGIPAALGQDDQELTDRKMIKNRARQWSVTGDGHGQHIEGGAV